MPGPQLSRTFARLWPVALAAAVVVAVLVRVHRGWIAAEPVPHWDEALHLLAGELLATDIRQGDWWGAAYDAYRMSMWPPLHAFVLSLFFLGGGPSLATGRMLSGAAFGLLAALSGLAAHRLGHRSSRETGSVSTAAEVAIAPTVAILLVATCAPLAPFAGQAMLECSGLLALTGALLAFAADERRPSPSTQAMLALASIATFMVRINYGILIVLALIVEAIIASLDQGVLPTWRRRRIVAACWIAFLAFWFAYPAKLQATWQTLVNAPFAPPAEAPTGVLFAPWALVEIVGWPAGLGFVAALAISLKRGDRSVRFSALLCTLHLGLVAVHQSKVLRHALPLLPPVAVLCGWGAAEFVSWSVRSRRRRLRPALVAAVLVGLLVVDRLVPLAARIEAQRPTTRTAEWRQAGEAIARLARGERFLLVSDSRLAEVEPPALDWLLVGELRILDASRAGSLGAVGHETRAQRALDRLRRIGVSLPGAERAVNRSTASDRSRSLYVQSSSAEFASLEALLDRLELNQFPAVLVLSGPAPNSIALRGALGDSFARRGLSLAGTIDREALHFDRFDRTGRSASD